jgi:hypothetical protein
MIAARLDHGHSRGVCAGFDQFVRNRPRRDHKIELSTKSVTECTLVPPETVARESKRNMAPRQVVNSDDDPHSLRRRHSQRGRMQDAEARRGTCEPRAPSSCQKWAG